MTLFVLPVEHKLGYAGGVLQRCACSLLSTVSSRASAAQGLRKRRRKGFQTPYSFGPRKHRARFAQGPAQGDFSMGQLLAQTRHAKTRKHRASSAQAPRKRRDHFWEAGLEAARVVVRRVRRFVNSGAAQAPRKVRARTRARPLIAHTASTGKNKPSYEVPMIRV